MCYVQAKLCPTLCGLIVCITEQIKEAEIEESTMQLGSWMQSILLESGRAQRIDPGFGFVVSSLETDLFPAELALMFHCGDIYY